MIDHAFAPCLAADPIFCQIEKRSEPCVGQAKSLEESCVRPRARASNGHHATLAAGAVNSNPCLRLILSFSGATLCLRFDARISKALRQYVKSFVMLPIKRDKRCSYGIIGGAA